MNDADIEQESIRLLLVEDDVESGQALKVMLEKRGVTVTLLPSAEEARDIFHAQDFDIVVADIRLKVMSGVDLLRIIRDVNAEFPVILLTGYDSVESAIQAIRLGAQDYILKPLDSIDNLLLPARNAVRSHRLFLRTRVLEHELLLAEERERRQLADDLHDSVGQLLAVAKLKLDAAIDGKQETDRNMRKVRELITQAIQRTRTLTFQLSPPSLYELGLGAALDDLTEQTGKTHGIEACFRDDRQLRPTTEDMKVLLFRAVRELLINVVKHAQAQHIEVSISRHDNELIIVVSDDGVGFDPAGVPRRGCDSCGFGLFSIRERLHHLGGRATIESSSGQGTKVTLAVPLLDA